MGHTYDHSRRELVAITFGGLTRHQVLGAPAPVEVTLAQRVVDLKFNGECVKARRQPEPNIEHSHRATVCCHLGNIAFYTRRAVHWEGATESILDDPKAAGQLSRSRRKGYKLPV